MPRVLAVSSFVVFLAAAPGGGGESPAPTVAVEILATDLEGNPVAPLAPDDLEVHQDGVRQTITRLAPREPAGAYEVRYVPTAGKPGPMTVRSARKGLLVRGPRGGDLRPRLIPTPTVLEAELLALADAAPGPAPLPCDFAALRFGTGPRGTQYVAAVEVSQAALAEVALGAATSALQIVARLRRDDGSDERLISHQRPLDAPGPTHRLVWTSYYELPSGAYTLDVVARESTTKRYAVKRLPLSVPAPRAGLRMSSLVFLQHFPAQLALEPVAGDPLVHKGVPVFPALALTLPYQTDAQARFYVLVFPDPADGAPVSLELHVLREDQLVGTVPIRLPPAEDGRIAFVGNLPTRTFREAPYRLRLVARQGESTATEEATLVISADAKAPRPDAVRIRN